METHFSLHIRGSADVCPAPPHSCDPVSGTGFSTAGDRAHRERAGPPSVVVRRALAWSDAGRQFSLTARRPPRPQALALGRQHVAAMEEALRQHEDRRRQRDEPAAAPSYRARTRCRDCEASSGGVCRACRAVQAREAAL